MMGGRALRRGSGVLGWVLVWGFWPLCGLGVGLNDGCGGEKWWEERALVVGWKVGGR